MKTSELRNGPYKEPEPEPEPEEEYFEVEEVGETEYERIYRECREAYEEDQRRKDEQREFEEYMYAQQAAQEEARRQQLNANYGAALDPGEAWYWQQVGRNVKKGGGQNPFA